MDHITDLSLLICEIMHTYFYLFLSSYEFTVLVTENTFNCVRNMKAYCGDRDGLPVLPSAHAI